MVDPAVTGTTATRRPARRAIWISRAEKKTTTASALASSRTSLVYVKINEGRV